jgi:hypothetical protein
MINSIWNSHGFHWIPYGMQTYPYGFHGTFQVDSMEQFHMDCVEIPWNKAPFPWETALSKIM